MGGKTQTATQQVQIPPEVMARYRAVNTRAETVAGQPFQPYSSDPNAFVAPLTPTQVAGMQNINQAAGMAQPYFNTAAGLTLGGAQGVGPLTQQQIGYYQNPYTQAVVGSTLAGLQQQQGQQLAQQQANAIRAGAFGGDRAGIERAQLMGQQNLAMAQAIAPLYQQGYQQAVQTAAGQQGVLAQDLQRQLAAGQQLGGLGAAGQQAALAGAQAQLGAGTAEQQTQQAGLQALYNQFLQERGYPFQVAQFLANIAMGTGALSGSTTTTTQPAPFFSDEDNKRNIRVLGKDPQTGLNVIAYDDADDLRKAREYGEPMPPKRVSYSAQEIERRAPGLVREVGGNKVVGMADGGAPPFALRAPVMGAAPGLGVAAQVAAPQAANVIPISRGAYRPNLAPKATGFSLGTPAASSDERGFGRFARLLEMMQGRNRGGYQSMGGLVSEPGNYATGGSIVGENDMKAILAAIGAPLEFYGGKGLYGGAAKGGAGSPGYVPQGQASIPKLVTAGGLPRMPESGLSQAAQTGSQIAELAKMGKSALVGSEGVGGKKGSTGLIGSEGSLNNRGYISGLGGAEKAAPGEPMRLASAPPADVENVRDYALDLGQIGEMVAARGGLMRHHYDLGGSTPYSSEDLGEDPLKDVVKEGSGHKYQLATPGKPPAPTPGLGSELMGAAKLAKTGSELYGMLPAGVTEGLGSAASGLGSALSGAGAAAAEGIGALGSSLAAGGAELLALLPALFSDERMKDNVERVGELYDGQPIYRYNMKGSNKTQIGLMAQDVERNGHRDAVAGLGGLKMVDYKRATDVAAGLAPREGMYRGGYQDGGLTEEDLPLVLAALQEPAREAERPAGVGIVPRVVMSDADPVPAPTGVVVASRAEPPAPPAREPERPAGVVPPPSGAASAATGVIPPPPSRDDVIREFLGPNRQVESGGQNIPNLAGRSSAFGPHQITEGTWRTIITRHPQLGLTMEDRFKAEAQELAAPYHARDLAGALESNGLPVTRENLRMGWFLGESGGPAFLAQMRERPDAPAYTLASPAAVRANPETFFKPDGSPRTAQEMYSMMASQVNRAAGVAGPSGGATGVVPTRATPGIAGPGRGPMDPASAPISTLLGGMFEGVKPETRAALTSENLWVPALAGIGSMLASRSPYLASAVGEGLVGGTKAYTDLQKLQQEMGESRARTEQTMADVAQKAFFEYAGRGMVRYQKLDGTYGAMSFADYFALPPGRRPPVDPRFKEYLDQIEPTVRTGGAGAGSPAAGTSPAGSPTTPPAPATPPAGAPARPSGVPTTVNWSPEDRTEGGKTAFDVARQISLENRATLDERRRNDFFQPQRAAATASQGVMQLTMPMAATIMSLPTGQSLATSGPFTAAIQPYVAAMNNLVETAIGRRGAVIDPNILGDLESVNKEIARLRSQTTTEAGQRAVTALEEMAKGIVSLKNAREGQTRILSKVLTDTQRNIDKDRWFTQWIEAGSTAPGGESGTFSDYARLSGQEANQEFDRRYSEAYYGEERKNLQKMMETRIGGTTSQGGQPMTVFEYVAKNAAQLPPDQIIQFADRFGDNTLRYFGIAPNRVQQLRQEMRNREQTRG